MKNLILLIGLTISINAKAMETVPQNWLSLNDIEENTNFKTSENKLSQFGNYFEEILDFQEGVISQTDKNNETESSWKLSGYKTDLSVSKSGIFGLSSVNAKSAVELNWKKVEAGKLLDEKEDDTAVELSNEMTEEEINSQLESIISMAVNSGKVKNESKLRKNLQKKAKEINSLLMGLDKDMGSSWTPFKFRLQLLIGVSGDFMGVTELGGSFRVRFDYKITKSHNAATAIPTRDLKRLEKFRKLIVNISEDIESVAEKAEQKSGYRLGAVSFGITAAKNNFFGLAKTKGAATGIMFFKKTSNKSLLKNESEIPLVGNYMLIDEHTNPDNKIFGALFKRSRFRKGLEKAFKIGHFFAEKSQKKKGKWIVNKIKVQFALSHSGIFGLSGTSGTGIAQIHLDK